MTRFAQPLTAILVCLVLLLQPVVMLCAACGCQLTAMGCQNAESLALDRPTCCGNSTDDASESLANPCDCGSGTCRCKEVSELPTTAPLAMTAEREVASTIDLTGPSFWWSAAEPSASPPAARQIRPPMASSSQAILCRWLI